MNENLEKKDVLFKLKSSQQFINDLIQSGYFYSHKTKLTDFPHEDLKHALRLISLLKVAVEDDI